MELRKLAADCKDRDLLEEINHEAFPPSERMNTEELFQFAQRTDTDILGIYDNDLLVGFIVLVKNEPSSYLYYLAIDHRLRSKGYGSKAIQALLSLYSHLQITLDFEVLDPAAPNLEQRKRRREFYLRNGFHETGYYTVLNGEKFELVCNGGELKKEPLLELLKILHQHRLGFLESLFPL